jgi:hypothetical protein
LAGPSTREVSPVSPRGQAADNTANDLLGIVTLLALALALRFIIAYRLLPGSGFPNDLGAFQAWASEMARNGTTHFYDGDRFLDYPPVYLLFLSWLGKLFGGDPIGDGIKLIPIFADLALAFVVWVVARDLGAARWRAYAAAAVIVINPITWINSAIWGQADAVGSVFLLLGLRELIKDRRETAAVLAVVATLTKLQLGVLAVLVGVVILRRSLLPRSGPRDPLRVASSIGAGLLTGAFICLPFTGFDFGVNLGRLGTQAGLLTVAAGLLAGAGVFFLVVRLAQALRDAAASVRLGLASIAGLATFALFGGMYFDWMVKHILGAFGEYPYLTVNAYNPWALVTTGDGAAMDRNLAWVRDAAYTSPEGWTDPGFIVGPFSGTFVSSIALLFTVLVMAAVGAWLAARRLSVSEPEVDTPPATAGILPAELRALAGCCIAGAAVLGFLLYAQWKGGVSAQVAGDAALIAVLLAAGAAAAWRDDARSLTVALAILAIAFFVLPTRAHERYLFPFFGVGAVLLAVSWRWTIAYLALVVANVVNLVAVLGEYCGIPSNEPYSCLGRPAPLLHGNQQLSATFIDWGEFMRTALWPTWIDWGLVLATVLCALVLTISAGYFRRLPGWEGLAWLLAISAGIVSIVIWAEPAKIIWPVELAGIVTGAVLVWALLQLRERAVDTLARETAGAAGPPALPEGIRRLFAPGPSDGD